MKTAVGNLFDALRGKSIVHVVGLHRIICFPFRGGQLVVVRASCLAAASVNVSRSWGRFKVCIGHHRVRIG